MSELVGMNLLIYAGTLWDFLNVKPHLGNTHPERLSLCYKDSQDTKEFDVVGSLTYEDIFNHPEEYAIPTREDEYGN